MFHGEFDANGHNRASRVPTDCAGTLTGAGAFVVDVVAGVVVVTTGRVVVVVVRFAVVGGVRRAHWASTIGCDEGWAAFVAGTLQAESRSASPTSRIAALAPLRRARALVVTEFPQVITSPC